MSCCNETIATFHPINIFSLHHPAREQTHHCFLAHKQLRLYVLDLEDEHGKLLPI